MNIFNELDKYFYPNLKQKSVDYLRNIPLLERDLNELKDDPEFQSEYLSQVYVFQEMVDKENAKHG